MAFMDAQMTGKEFWYAVDGPMGTEFVPEDLTGYLDLNTLRRVREGSVDGTPLAGYCENRRPWTIERVYGYGVRSSAPGYMDCTPWTVYHAKRDAVKAYNEERRACRGDD